jgi:hypothetical protein
MGKENNHILIKVTPNFIEKNSMIEFNKYVFAYEVEIKNESSQPIQLISRHWIIENSKFEKFEVKGRGCDWRATNNRSWRSLSIIQVSLKLAPPRVLCGALIKC